MGIPHAQGRERISVSTPLPRVVRNRDIMLRALEGQSSEAIAQLYDLTPETISRILESPLVQDELQRLQGELNKDLVSKVKARSHEALETVTDVMRGEVGSELRFKAAKDILDRNPELQPKQQDLAGAIGAGMGEFIVREFARMRSERREGKDERRNSTGGSAQETIVEGAGAGSRSGQVCDDGGDAPVEGEMVESGGD